MEILKLMKRNADVKGEVGVPLGEGVTKEMEERS